ncbi:MAG TPA: hypothetical protein VEZ12_07850 [Herpetosiphonaceae bacterium]|nr:hypothetical protein [Herpetosiphonaceae bacterium]
MERRRLIFFTNSDPGIDPRPARDAYHFATVAARADLDAEVRLAGDAVKIALPGAIAATPAGDELREKVASGARVGYTISL